MLIEKFPLRAEFFHGQCAPDFPSSYVLLLTPAIVVRKIPMKEADLPRGVLSSSLVDIFVTSSSLPNTAYSFNDSKIPLPHSRMKQFHQCQSPL